MKKIIALATVVLASVTLQGCINVHYSGTKQKVDSIEYLKFDENLKMVSLQYSASSSTDRQEAYDIAKSFCANMNMTAKSVYLEKSGDTIAETYECKSNQAKKNRSSERFVEDDSQVAMEELF